MDEFITFEDAFAIQPKNYLAEILYWLELQKIFESELNPWDHEAFFEIPAYMRENWDVEVNN